MAMISAIRPLRFEQLCSLKLDSLVQYSSNVQFFKDGVTIINGLCPPAEVTV